MRCVRIWQLKSLTVSESSLTSSTYASSDNAMIALPTKEHNEDSEVHDAEVEDEEVEDDGPADAPGSGGN